MSGEKTHDPSARRLQKAREEGRVAVSRELSMLASLSAGTTAIAMSGHQASIAHWLSQCLPQSHVDAQIWRSTLRDLGLAVLSPSMAALGGYAAATLLQTGFLMHAGALRPDFARISPVSGMKRLLGPQAAVQVVKALAKLGLLGFCLYAVLGRLLPRLPQLLGTQAGSLYDEMLAQGGRLVLLLLGAQAAIAGADLLWERRRHARELRMSFQELRDEHRESEGNPQIKQRLRQLARARAGRRMMKAVPKAAVVITNPTHFAVALTYERGAQGAPRLVAKGADEVAARIRDLACEHRVPIVANPPLARALYRVELDTEIPAEHFRAVAEIIAYVWRMRAQALRR